MMHKVSAYPILELGKRTNQEDYIYPPFSEKPSNGDLFILCDGMGGHAAGEVASQTVCDAMSNYIEKHPTEDGLFVETDFAEALGVAYNALDARDNGEEKKMGTTLAFVKFHVGGCFTAHIGDSRIYHIRPSEQRILHVTRDHSLVNDLIELGEMTPDEARTSHQKNVITRAMQPHQENRVKADCFNLVDLKAGDYIYMCSDGMLEEMEDRELINILSLSQSDPKKLAILKGVTNNNKDNHSAYLIRIVSVGESPCEETTTATEESTTESNSCSKGGYSRLIIFLVILILIILIAYYFISGGLFILK